MKKILYTASLVVATLFSSCSEYTDGLNVDPNEFSDAPGELLIGQAALSLATLSEGQNSRFTSIFVDQFNGCDRQYINYEQYVVVASDFDDPWNDVFVSGIAQAKLAKAKAIESGNDPLEGVALAIEASLFGEMAALYGDIPFTEAGDYDNFPNPSYDSQASVLNAVQGMLDEALPKVEGISGLPFLSNIFALGEGNTVNWTEIIHSLKARYYLIAKDYNNALAEAQQGISSPSGDLKTSHSAANGSENLYWQFIVEQRGGYLASCNDPLLLRFLDGTTPRRLATPGDSERLSFYFDTVEDQPNVNSGGLFAVDADFPVINFVETKLIEAEAAARTGGDGQAPFNEVRAHLADTYGGDFPATTSTGETLIEEILEEKFISLPGSLQVFHDMRRTDDILGTVKGTNTTIPQRFLYPQVEINANENFPGLEDLFTPTAVNQ